MKKWKRVAIVIVIANVALAAFVGWLFYLSWLPFRPVTLAGMSGTYTGDYFGGTETYVLSSDGTFVQRFVKGARTVYVNKGRWTISRDTEAMVTTITFTPLMEPADLELRTDRPVRYDENSLEVVDIMEGFCLDVDDNDCVSHT